MYVYIYAGLCVCVCACARDCYLLLLSHGKQATVINFSSIAMDTITWVADKCLVLSPTYILRLTVALLQY